MERRPPGLPGGRPPGPPVKETPRDGACAATGAPLRSAAMQAKVRLAIVRTVLAVAVGLAAVATILGVVVVTATPRTTLHATLPGPDSSASSGPVIAGPTAEPLPSDETQPSSGPNEPPIGPPPSLLGAYRAPSLLVPLTD